jgi:hypothetical protein
MSAVKGLTQTGPQGSSTLESNESDWLLSQFERLSQ